MENNITVLVIDPNKGISKKEVLGNLHGFGKELNTEYVQAQELKYPSMPGKKFMLLYPQDQRPMFEKKLTCKSIIAKVTQDKKYASLDRSEIEDILLELIKLINFTCVDTSEDAPYSWEGMITYFRNYGSHYELQVNARGSEILVLIGRSRQGWFAAIPDHDAGCHLSSYLGDHFYNRERLKRAVGDIDGISIAAAINLIASTVEEIPSIQDLYSKIHTLEKIVKESKDNIEQLESELEMVYSHFHERD